MKKNIKRKTKKVLLTFLVTIFALQQSAISVFAAPPEVCPVTTMDGQGTSLVIEETALLAGDQLIFYIDDELTPGCQPATPQPDFSYVRISKDTDGNLVFDATDEEIAYFETGSLVANNENKFSYQLSENLNSGIYYVMFGQNGYSLNQFSVTAQDVPAPSVTGGSISVFAGETQITTNDTEIEAGSTLAVDVMLQFDGGADTASDLSNDISLNFVSSLDNTTDLGVAFTKINPDLNDGKYQIIIPEDTTPGDYFIRLSQAGGLQNGSYAEQGFKVVAQPTITLENVLFGSNSPVTLSANSPLALNIRAYYSDAPNTATSLKDSNEVKFQLTDAQDLVVDDQSILNISFVENSKFLAKITTPGEYKINLFITDNVTVFDTLSVQVLNSIEDSTVVIETPSVNLDEPVLFTTLIKLSNGEPLTAQTLENIYPQIYKKNGEETYELSIDAVGSLDENGGYGTSMDTDLNGDVLEPGTYAVALHTFNQDGSLQILTGLDGISYFEFELVANSNPEEPNETTFSAETQDANHDGFLDAIQLDFPELVEFLSLSNNDFSVEGYNIESILPINVVVVEEENFVQSLKLIIEQDSNNPVYDTGATPQVTINTDMAGITAPKTVTSTDKANPVAVDFSANGNENLYTTAIVELSEDVDKTNIPDSTFVESCGETLESCIFVTYKNTISTNTFTFTAVENEDNDEVTFIYGDASKYPFPENAEAQGLPDLLIVVDSLLFDLIGNPLLANSERPLQSISLSSTDTLTALDKNASFAVKTRVKYYGLEATQENLPAGYSFSVDPNIANISFSNGVGGSYTVTLPASVTNGTYELELNNSEKLVTPLSFTVAQSEAPSNDGGNNNGGNNGGGPGGGILPQNKAPEAKIKEILSSIFSGTPMTVDGTLSTDPNNDPIFYSWNFGDNTTTTELSTLDGVYTHTYANPGTYTITLKVQDSNQASDTTSTIVTVLQGQPVEDSQTNTSTPTTNEPEPTNNNEPTVPQVNTPVSNPVVVSETVVDTNDETLDETEQNTEEVLTTSNENSEQAISEASEEEVPDWLAWLFGSSTAVAAVWTGILANRYRKYVA